MTLKNDNEKNNNYSQCNLEKKIVRMPSTPLKRAQ
jgi:hypothetical protein